MTQSRELPRLLSQVLELPFLPVAISDGEAPDFPIVCVNQAFEELTGYKNDDLVGQSIRLIQNPEGDGSPDIIASMSEVLERGRPATFALETLRKDGSCFRNKLNLAPLDNTDGHRYVVGIHRDVVDSELSHHRMALAQSVVDGTHDGILVSDSQSQIIYVNPAFNMMSGYCREDVVGQSLRVLASPRHSEKFYDDVLREVVKHGYWSGDLWSNAADGSQLHQHTTISAIKDALGNVTHYVAVVRDVTRNRLRQALVSGHADNQGGIGLLEAVNTSPSSPSSLLGMIDPLVHERLALAQAVVDGTHDGILITDAFQRIIDVNPAFMHMTGFERDEAIGQEIAFISSPKHDHGFFTAIFDAVDRNGYWNGDLWNARKDGTQLIQHTTLSAIYDDVGAILHYVGVFRDITLRRINQTRLERMAIYDPLTKLFNREHFNTALRAQLTSQQFTHTGTALIFIDLDDFKPINDNYGHAVGDEVLIAVSARLKQVVRSTDLVARFGGDEFVVALTGMSSSEESGFVANKILHCLVEPLGINGNTFQLSASLGVAYTADTQVSAEMLTDAADHAMYQAKNGGKNSVVLDKHIAPGHAQDALSRIAEAISSDELCLYYQPIYEIKTRAVAGFEVLTRWHHPTQGVLGAGHFIDLISNSALSIPFSEWLIRAAAKMSRHLRRAGAPYSISINLAQDQLESGGFLDILREVYFEETLKPELVIEVLESTQFDDIDLAASSLQDARMLGAKIALDDFGTGVSSITYASQLPIDYIKVDGSVVRHTTSRADRRQLLQAIIDMAHGLDLIVVAEGVEKECQLDLLEELGCDRVQGFLLARPMPAEDLERRFMPRLEQTAS